MTRYGRALVVALALLTAATWAAAQEKPIVVDVAVRAELLDADALREAIAHELECTVVANLETSHRGEIAVKAVSASQVSVSFLPPDRTVPLQRTVTLPRKAENRVQLIAWLVGNMVRNEAAEWLAEHQRQKAAIAGVTLASADATAATEPTKAAENLTAETATNEKKDGSAGNAANTKKAEGVKKPEAQAPTAATADAVSPSIFDERALRPHAMNLALWHGLLELHPDAAQSRFGFHFGLGYGRVGAIRGFGFDVLHHREDFYLHGVAGSVIWTRASRTDGVAFSFGVVTARGELHGADLAQFVAIRDGDVNGLQLAGLATMASGNVVGGQGAALFNASGHLRGLQLAWGANVARDVAGFQGSFVNVARNVQGLQFGLVNVAERVDGVQIGLVNVASNVRAQAQLWSERNYLENVGVRYVYAPLLFAVSTGYDSSNDRLRLLFGFGARFAYSRVAFAPSVDVGAVIDKVRTDAVGRGHDNDVRLSFEWELLPRVLSVVGGPTLAFRQEGNTQLKPLPRWFVGLTLH